MAAATYRIGPSDFFTPGDLKADADTLQAQVAALDQAVRASNAGVDFSDAWEAWIGRWSSFYSDHWGGFFSSWTTAINDSNRDELVSFENQFQSFYSQARAAGAVDYTPNVEPSTGSGDSIGKQLAASGLGGIATQLIIGVIVALIAIHMLEKA